MRRTSLEPPIYAVFPGLFFLPSTYVLIVKEMKLLDFLRY
jgi:hypothetical protein